MNFEDLRMSPQPCAVSNGSGRKRVEFGFNTVQESLLGNCDGIQQGLVAYFDILGFSKIASDENIREAAKIIKGRLLSIQNEIREETVRKSGPREKPTSSIIFADSILLWYEIPQGERASEAEPLYWFDFFSDCAALMERMFNYGLPLRGAISEGNFFIEQHCFVGKPIIECHELERQSAWCGCAIVGTAWERLEQIWQKRGPFFKDIMEQVCVEYRVPLKSDSIGSETARPALDRVIKWFHKKGATDNYDPCISNSVYEAFTDNGKIVGEKEKRYAKNTEEFLRHVESLYVNSNQKRPNRANES